MTRDSNPERILRITGVDADSMSDREVAVTALVALRLSQEEPEPVDGQAAREAADRKRWTQSNRPDAPRDWRYSQR